MKKLLLVLCCAALVGVSGLQAGESKGSSCCLKDGKAHPSEGKKMRCTLTDKVVDKCCCEEKDGKHYCTLAKKSVDKCCCEPVGEEKPKA